MAHCPNGTGAISKLTPWLCIFDQFCHWLQLYFIIVYMMTRFFSFFIYWKILFTQNLKSYPTLTRGLQIHQKLDGTSAPTHIPQVWNIVFWNDQCIHCESVLWITLQPCDDKVQYTVVNYPADAFPLWSVFYSSLVSLLVLQHNTVQVQCCVV